MKICLAQTKAIKGNIERNIEDHKKWIELAVAQKADLIVFPELSLTGYEPELAAELATDQSDNRLNDFQAMSDWNKIVIGVGLPTRSPSGIFISMVIFQPNKEGLTYSKQKLHADEEPYFIAGCNQVLLNIKDKKIALAICYESLQPKHAANAYSLGADIYLASVAKSQSGIEKVTTHFPNIAAKYAMPVLLCNSIGYCDNFESAGQTAVWDENGSLLAQLDSQNEGILCYDTETKSPSLPRD